jgi:hypothetical protein
MADSLEKVIDTAKKLRRAAKRIDDVELQILIVDLNLHVADLKMHLAEAQAEELLHGGGGTAREPEAAKPAPQARHAPADVPANPPAGAASPSPPERRYNP